MGPPLHKFGFLNVKVRIIQIIYVLVISVLACKLQAQKQTGASPIL